MTYEQQIERLVAISKSKPLLPENFVPWENPIGKDEFYLPEHLTTLYELPEYRQLTHEQKLELGKKEIAQVMYSYSFTESLLCMFLNRYTIHLDTTSLEYNFLIRELIEEYRHQEMFSKGVTLLQSKPIMPNRFQKILGIGSVKNMSTNLAFLSCLSVEMIADRYGDIIKKDKTTFSVIRKIAELHAIEEARHVLYAKLFLERRIMNKGFIKRTLYSYVILINIWYMRALYVNEQFYKDIGLSNTKQLYKKAKEAYKHKFADLCDHDVVPFVKQINGFNFLTRPLWKSILKVKL